jgi:Divergent InlB B-repeat domain
MRLSHLGAVVLLIACGGDDSGGPVDTVDPPQLFTVTVIGSGLGEGQVRSIQGGTLDCALGAGRTCSETIEEETDLSVEAAPDPSADFRRWESDAGACGTSATCTLSVDRPLTLIARFELKVAGSWTGPIREQGNTVARLDLALNEANGAVTGEGTLGNGAGSIAVTASGTYDGPDLALALRSEGLESVNLTAVVSKADMRGTLSGSGFNNTPIRMTRQ